MKNIKKCRGGPDNAKFCLCRGGPCVRPLKKIIITLLIILFLPYGTVFGNSADLNSYIDQLKSYGTELFPEIYQDGFIEELLTGNINIDSENLLERISNIFIGEIRTSMKLVFKILTICIFCAIIKNLQSTNDSGVSEVAFYVCYLIIATLIITSFINVVDLCRDTVKTLNAFVGVLIPIIIIYLTISGHVVVVSTLQPVLIGMITLISNLVSKALIPIILISTILSIVSNISEEIDVSKIGALLKKSALFVLELLLIIFVGVLSLEGSLAANVDGIVAKTTKTVVSTTIPVVGKLIGDATDSVIGATSIAKNALGFVGVLIIISICLIPFIKSMIMMIVFNVSAAISEPFVDKRIAKCFGTICDSTKIIVRNTCRHGDVIYNRGNVAFKN